MADIAIPGVSDKYKTNDYIEALMNKERVPLTREQDALDGYKEQQSAWNGVSQKMSALRTTTKSLYSFDNPFNNKLASSTDENAVTATPGREAEIGSLKIDVIKPASADRFLSNELEKDATVPKGKYTFQIAEKKISFQWKGGKINDFITSLNKRGGEYVKASLVGVSGNKKSLLIESLKTGSENNLVFKDDALAYALKNGLIEKTRPQLTEFGSDPKTFVNPPEEAQKPAVEQDGMPAMTVENLSVDSEAKKTIVPPRSGYMVAIDPELLKTESEKIDFKFSLEQVEDITEELNIKRTTRPELPEAGNVNYDEITIENQASETNLPPVPAEPLVPITDAADFYVHTAGGTEYKLDVNALGVDEETGVKTVSIVLKDYPDADGIIIRNRNTGTQVTVSPFEAYDDKDNLGYMPVHPADKSGDAIIKYEGITINRPTNTIDDVVPHVTLNIHNKTEKTATIKIDNDKDGAKDALIQFVGKYNQTLAEINILSSNKPEIISELDYLTDDEQEAAKKRLGMFQGDFSLSNERTSMQHIISANYKWSDTALVTMLSQIGISTRASGNGGGTYSPSQMRGYLEINENELDQKLESNMDDIKNLFGYDSDGDLVIDSGIGYQLDQQLSSWVQSGGIIATKNRAISTKITASENKIKKLEDQLEGKEARLRAKYGQMEGTLNSLNAQSNTVQNWVNGGRQQ